jgi:putative ABC transport system permease protein
MFKNYFNVAIRTLWRNKSYSLLNIIGLAVGVASCLLLFVIVNFELSYDKFHSKHHQIYRIITEDKYPNGNIDPNPGVPIPVTEALRLDIPQFKKVASLNATYGSQIIVLDENTTQTSQRKKFIEPIGIFFIEPQMFEIFDSKWLEGNPQTSLKTPNQVVLSKSQAEKYFGNWKNALGKSLRLDNLVKLTVSGIIADQPNNTDLPFKILISFDTFKKYGSMYNYNTHWGSTSSNHQVYVWMPGNHSKAEVKKWMLKFREKHYKPKKGTDLGKIHITQPLSDIHYNTRYGTFGDHQTSLATIYTLIFIGILIISMACINFINLATAQAVGRSREVGIRKVLGGYRWQLFRQFMGEMSLIVMFSVLLGLVLAELALPYIRQVSNVPENLPFLMNPTVWIFLVLTSAVITVLSGFYPSLILSGFDPVQALKNKISVRSIGNVSLRRGLVITQFSISQILIVCTWVAVSQMNFIRKIDLGFRQEAVYITSISGDSLSQQKFNAFKSEISKINGVKGVSLSSDPPSSDNNWATNFGFDRDTTDADFATFLKFADTDYFNVYGLELLAGRIYQAGDTAREYIVNETLLKKLGVKNPQDALGKKIRLGGGPKKSIVGVVKDFKANSVREEMKPMVISTAKNFYFRAGIKVQPESLTKTVNSIRDVWEKYFPEYVFEGYFLDERIAQFYIQENQLAKVYQIFAGLAIFISCLGLYGLISFLTLQKTKEIGIRKVLGASMIQLVNLLTKDFVRMVLLAVLISTPAAYYLMTQWLQNFVYRIEISWITFVCAGLIAAGVALATIAYQSIKAAMTNPIDVLRNE